MRINRKASRKVNPLIAAAVVAFQACLLSTSPSVADSSLRVHQANQSPGGAIRSVTALRGGGFAFLEDDPLASSAISVARVDPEGRPLWRFSYSGFLRVPPAFFQGMGAPEIAQLPDGNLAVGCTWIGTTADPAILNLDLNGAILSLRTFDDGSDQEVESMSLTDDGGMVLSGRSALAGPPLSEPFVMRVGPAPTYALQSYRKWSVGKIHALRPMLDGGFIAVGSQPNSFRGTLWAVRLDKTLAVVWDRTYEYNCFFANFSEGVDVVQASDCGAVILSQLNNGTDLGDLWVMKIDDLGNPDWHSYASIDNDTAHRIAATRDGGYVVIGTSYLLGSYNKYGMWIYRLAQDGQPIWSRAVTSPLGGGGLAADGLDVIESDDGRLVAVGFVAGLGPSSSTSGRTAAILDRNGEVLSGSSCLAVPNLGNPFWGPVPTCASPTGLVPTAPSVTTSFPPSPIPAASSLAVYTECNGKAPDRAENDNTCQESSVTLHSGETLFGSQSDGFAATPDWFAFHGRASTPSYTLNVSALASATVVISVIGPGCGGATIFSYTGLPTTPLSFSVPADGTYHVSIYMPTTYGNSASQYSVTLTGNTTPSWNWARSVGLSKIDAGVIGLEDDAGGIDVIGSVTFGTSIFASSHLSVIPFREDGTPMSSSRRYGLSFSDRARPTYAVRRENGGALIVGATTVSPDGFLLATNPDGSVAWGRRMNVGSADEFASVARIATGGYYAVGSAGNAGQTDLALVKLDSAGVVLWSRRVGQPLSETEVGRAVLVDADMGAVVLAEHCGTGVVGGCEALLLRFDPLGALTWSRSYQLFGGIRPRGMARTTDGEFGFVGSTGSPSDLVIVRTNSSGEPLWSRRLGGAASDDGRQVVVDANGGWVVAGSTSSFGGNTEGWLVKLDATGQSIGFQQRFGGPYNDALNSVTSAVDGGFIAAGSTVSYLAAGQQELFVLKVDTNGQILPPVCGAQHTTNALPVAITPTVTCPALVPLGTPPVLTNYTLGQSSFAPKVNYPCTAHPPPLPPDEVSPAGSDSPLSFATTVRLQWEEQGNNRADSFNLYRGDLASLSAGNYGTCLASSIPSNEYMDYDSPASGLGWFYLVGGVNEFGAGSLGSDSSDHPRTAGEPCP